MVLQGTGRFLFPTGWSPLLHCYVDLLKGLVSVTFQFCSVPQTCLTLSDPMDCSIPGLLVHHELPVYSNSSPLSPVMPPSHLILCRSLLLQPSIFPSIRVFSSESVLRIRWPNYWSFSFSISPSNE